jgi:hypothetical protein
MRLTSLLDDVFKLVEKLTTDFFKKNLPKLIEDLKKLLRKEGYGIVNTGPESLPRGDGYSTVFCFRRGEKVLYVIEELPKLRKIMYSDMVSGERVVFRAPVVEYELSFPYVIFFVLIENGIFQNVRVCFKNERMFNANDALSVPALPNLDIKYRVCYGSGIDSIKGLRDPDEIVDSAIKTLWGSVFTRDHPINMNVSRLEIPQISTWANWQENSKADKDFAEKIFWPLIPSRTSVHNLVLEIFQYPVDETLSSGFTEMSSRALTEDFSKSVAESVQEESGRFVSDALSKEKERESK